MINKGRSREKYYLYRETLTIFLINIKNKFNNEIFFMNFDF